MPFGIREVGEEGQRSGGGLRGDQVNSQGVEVIAKERASEQVRAKGSGQRAKRAKGGNDAGCDRSSAWRLKTGLGGTPEARWRGHEDVGGHSAQPEAEMPNVLPRNNLRKQARPPLREGAGSHASAPPRQHSEAEATRWGARPPLAGVGVAPCHSPPGPGFHPKEALRRCLLTAPSFTEGHKSFGGVPWPLAEKERNSSGWSLGER